jgi:phosphate transport system permease protein
MIYGTLMTSLIALLIAVPVSFGIALFLDRTVTSLAEEAVGHGD